MKSKTNKKNNVKKNNHLYPFFHIKKWINFKGRLYDKQKNQIVDIERNVFSLPFYYSLGKRIAYWKIAFRFLKAKFVRS